MAGAGERWNEQQNPMHADGGESKLGMNLNIPSKYGFGVQVPPDDQPPLSMVSEQANKEDEQVDDASIPGSPTPTRSVRVAKEHIDTEGEHQAEALKKLYLGDYPDPQKIAKKRRSLATRQASSRFVAGSAGTLAPTISRKNSVATSMVEISSLVTDVIRVAVTPASVKTVAVLVEVDRWVPGSDPGSGEMKKVAQAKLLDGDAPPHSFGDPEYDTDDAHKVRPIYDPKWAVEAIAISADRSYLALGLDERVKIFCLKDELEDNIADDDFHVELKMDGMVRVVAFCPKSEWLAVGGENNTASIFTNWNVWTNSMSQLADSQKPLDLVREPAFQYLDGDEEVWAIAFSPNRDRLAVGGEDKRLSCFALTAKYEEKNKNSGFMWEISRSADLLVCAFSPESTRIAAGGEDNCVGIIDAATGICLHTVKFPYKVTELFFSFDSMRLFVGGESKKASIFDVHNGEKLHGDLEMLGVALMLNNTQHRKEVLLESNKQHSTSVLYTVLEGATGSLEWREKRREEDAVRAAVYSKHRNCLFVGGEGDKDKACSRVLEYDTSGFAYDDATQSDGKAGGTRNASRRKSSEDARTPVLRRRLQCVADVFAIAVSSDGQWLAVGCEEESPENERQQKDLMMEALRMEDENGNAQRGRKKNPKKARRPVAVERQGMVAIYDTRTESGPGSVTLSTPVMFCFVDNDVTSVCFDPESKLLAAGCVREDDIKQVAVFRFDPTSRTWNGTEIPQQKTLPREVKDPWTINRPGGVFALAFSSFQTNVIAVGGLKAEGEVRVCASRSRCISRATAHRLLLVVFKDGVVAFYNVEAIRPPGNNDAKPPPFQPNDTEVPSFHEDLTHEAGVLALAYYGIATAEKKFFATGDQADKVIMHEYCGADGKWKKLWTDTRSGNVTCVAFSLQGEWLAAGGEDKMVILYDVDGFLNGEKLTSVRLCEVGLPASVRSCGFLTTHPRHQQREPLLVVGGKPMDALFVDWSSPVPFQWASAEMKVVAAVPFDAGTALENKADVQGNVVLISPREIVGFSEKVKTALVAGAVAVILVNTVDRLMTVADDDSGYASIIPVLLIKSSDAARLREHGSARIRSDSRDSLFVGGDDGCPISIFSDLISKRPEDSRDVKFAGGPPIGAIALSPASVRTAVDRNQMLLTLHETSKISIHSNKTLLERAIEDEQSETVETILELPQGPTVIDERPFLLALGTNDARTLLNLFIAASSPCAPLTARLAAASMLPFAVICNRADVVVKFFELLELNQAGAVFHATHGRNASSDVVFSDRFDHYHAWLGRIDHTHKEGVESLALRVPIPKLTAHGILSVLRQIEDEKLWGSQVMSLVIENLWARHFKKIHDCFFAVFLFEVVLFTVNATCLMKEEAKDLYKSENLYKERGTDLNCGLVAVGTGGCLLLCALLFFGLQSRLGFGVKKRLTRIKNIRKSKRMVLDDRNTQCGDLRSETVKIRRQSSRAETNLESETMTADDTGGLKEVYGSEYDFWTVLFYICQLMIVCNSCLGAVRLQIPDWLRSQTMAVESVTSILLLLVTFSFFRGYNALSYPVAVLRDNFVTMGPFLVVCFTFMYFFALAFMMLYAQNEFEDDMDDVVVDVTGSLPSALFTMFKMGFLGEFHTGGMDKAEWPWLTRITFVVYMTTLTVVALNALIAILGESFAKVMQGIKAAINHQKCDLIVEYYDKMPIKMRSKIESKTFWIHQLVLRQDYHVASAFDIQAAFESQNCGISGLKNDIQAAFENQTCEISGLKNDMQSLKTDLMELKQLLLQRNK